MSKFSITLSGDSINELAESLTLAASRLFSVGLDSTDAPNPAPAAAPAARTRGRPAKVVAEEAPAPVAAPVASPAAPAVDNGPLKAAAIAALVKLINANDALGRNGKQVCLDLCMSFGGKNVSTISADKYPAVIDAANKALETLNENPAA